MKFNSEIPKMDFSPKWNATAARTAALLVAFVAFQPPAQSIAQDSNARSLPKAATLKPEDSLAIQEPSSIAHGPAAQIVAKQGEYLHRWVGADGEPFVIANSQRADPGPEERRNIERAFGKRIRLVATPLFGTTPIKMDTKELRAVRQALQSYQAQLRDSVR